MTRTRTPNGRLAFSLSALEGLGVRSLWSDGKRQRLEDCLADFLAHLPLAAQAIKDGREAEKRRAIEHAEAERRWCEVGEEGLAIAGPSSVVLLARSSRRACGAAS